MRHPRNVLVVTAGLAYARDYDWATLDVSADDTPDGQAGGGVSVLPARRHR